MKRENLCLDLFKTIACIGIVFIHVEWPGTAGTYITALSRTGVAFFFLISGYFLPVVKDGFRIKVGRKLVRTARLCLYAFAVYFVWQSFTRFAGGGLEKVILWYQKDLFTIKNFFLTFIFSYDPVVGHLWFLLALLQGYLILYCIGRPMNGKKSFVAAVLLLEIHIGVMACLTLSEQDVYMHLFRSVWFYGLPFLLLGAVIRNYESFLLKRLSERLLVIGIIASMLLVVLERYCLGNLQIFNGTILMSTMCFVLALRYADLKCLNGVAAFGKRYAGDIYIYHWIFKEIFIKIQETLFQNQGWYEYVEPLGVLLSTIVFVICMQWVVKRMRYYVNEKK